MTYKGLHLRNIIDLKRWEEIQDKIAEVTKTAIITVDFRGLPVTKHSCCSNFCAAIRGNPATRAYCYKCDARGGLEAARSEKPYIYLCHCDIVDVAIPIVVNEKYLGAVMVGQVLLSNDESGKEPGAELEKIFNTLGLDEGPEQTRKKEVIANFNRLPRMTYSQIQNIADMIHQVINYILESAVSYANMTQSYEMMVQRMAPNKAKPSKGDWQAYRDREVGEQYTEGDRASSAAEQTDVVVSLRPAVEYIKTHLNENMPMEQIAKLCHLSPSYFSRLFTREMGETYSNYVSRQKIQQAKKMLETTNFTISQIAENLGFLDGGYFSKVFKKFEGTTPAEYRKYVISVKRRKIEE